MTHAPYRKSPFTGDMFLSKQPDDAACGREKAAATESRAHTGGSRSALSITDARLRVFPFMTPHPAVPGSVLDSNVGPLHGTPNSSHP
jgi:hypothetical protein